MRDPEIGFYVFSSVGSSHEELSMGNADPPERASGVSTASHTDGSEMEELTGWNALL